MEIFWFIVIGIVAGWIAGLIMKGRGFGVLGDLIVGVLGAVVGGMLFRTFGVSAYGISGAIVMAVIGAIVLLGAISIVKRA
ncbi:MAG: GlsB/YeaQ/YmgE family stress response membrane protein [Candidatus Peregrinibacteria bacterium]|nr:GlsB/YeaQ/YmgE family stress response membrane protein [Candidatus Peregrinibacteria bacterium]